MVEAPPGAAHALLLAVREPFAADAVLGFLAARAIEGVEAAQGGVYRRTLRLRHGHGVVELEPARGHVRCLAQLADPRDRDEAVRRCRALLDLDADPGAVDAHLSGDPLLAARVAAAPGLRVPGTAEPEELAIRAVLGQQVSVAGARTLAGRIAAEHGEQLDLGPQAAHADPDRSLGAGSGPGRAAAAPDGAPPRLLFPTMAALAGIDPATLAMPRARGRAVVALATALADGTVRLGPDADPIAARAALQAVPGIGPWTADYVAMRALGDRDTFLATDLAVRRGARALGEDDAPATLAVRAERWRPYRSYAMLHLWAAS